MDRRPGVVEVGGPEEETGAPLAGDLGGDVVGGGAVLLGRQGGTRRDRGGVRVAFEPGEAARALHPALLVLRMAISHLSCRFPHAVRLEFLCHSPLARLEAQKFPSWFDGLLHGGA